MNIYKHSFMCTHSISVKVSSYRGYGWLLYRSLGAISVLRCQYWNPHCIDQITFDHLITTIWIHTCGDKIIFDHLIALSYVHTCAGRLRSGGGRILTFPLRYRRYVHTYTERTRADLPFLEDNDGLKRAVSKRTRQIGCGTQFLRKQILLPLRLGSATAHVWTHVMISVEANFPPAFARACVNIP